MNLPGQQSPDSTLPSNDLSRRISTGIELKKLGAQLDCT